MEKQVIEIQVEREDIEAASIPVESEQPVDPVEPIRVGNKPVDITISKYKHNIFGQVIRVEFSRSVDHIDMTVDSAGTFMQRLKAQAREAITERRSRQLAIDSTKRRKRRRKIGRKQRKVNRRG